MCHHWAVTNVRTRRQIFIVWTISTSNPVTKTHAKLLHHTQVKRLLQEYILLYFLRGNKTQNIFYGSFGIWRQRALPKKVLTRVWTTYRIAKYIPTLLRYFNLIQSGIFLYNFSTLKTTYGPDWLNTDLINVILWSLLKKILPI